jgi:hypothetical protein
VGEVANFIKMGHPSYRTFNIRKMLLTVMKAFTYAVHPEL